MGRNSTKPSARNSTKPSAREAYVERIRAAISLDNMRLSKPDYIAALEELHGDLEGMIEAARQELAEEQGNG